MRQLGFLEWKDIDFKHSIINVNRSSLYLPEKGIFTDETKNNSSIRPVKVPDYVIQLLKKYRLQQKEQAFEAGRPVAGFRTNSCPVERRSDSSQYGNKLVP